MRVLVVGGTGFVGSHVVDALLAAGHRVRVLSGTPERFREPLPGVDHRVGRVQDGVPLTDVLDGCQAVVDAALVNLPGHGDPVGAVVDPLRISLWLAEQSRAAGVDTLVHLSSGGAVYGHGSPGRAARESDPLAPINAYGAAKAAIELAVGALLGPTGTRFVALRIANAYGERQDPARPQGIVGIALGRLVSGGPITVYGDMTRDFVHAADIGAAAALAVGTELAGPYNIGSGEAVRVPDVLAELERISGLRLEVHVEPPRSFEVLHSVVDVTRARDAGWRPQVGLSDGLARTWRWYRAHTGGASAG